MTARYKPATGQGGGYSGGVGGYQGSYGAPLWSNDPAQASCRRQRRLLQVWDGCIAACNAPFLPLPCSRPLALSAALRIVMTSVHGVHPCNARARHSHLRPCLYLVLHCTHTSRLFSLRCNDFDRHVRRRTHAPCLSAAGGPLEPGLSAERGGVQQRRQGRRGGMVVALGPAGRQMCATSATSRCASPTSAALQVLHSASRACFAGDGILALSRSLWPAGECPVCCTYMLEA